MALFVGGAIALSLDPPAQGWGVFVCVVAYVAALLWVCRATGRGCRWRVVAFGYGGHRAVVRRVAAGAVAGRGA